MALGRGLGKRVSGGVTLILVPGFELLQPSRLPSHCADEETETQAMDRSCLRPLRAEQGHPDSQSGALSSASTFCLARVGLTSLFSTAPGSRPVLETDSRLGVPGGRLKFLHWPVARVDVLRPFLQRWPSWPARRRKKRISAPAHCGVQARGPGHWSHVSLACGQAAPESICISQSPSRKQMARSTGLRRGS